MKLFVLVFAMLMWLGCTPQQGDPNLEDVNSVPVQKVDDNYRVPEEPTPTPTPIPSPTPTPIRHTVDEITAIATNSACSKYSFKNRGRAPVPFLQGTSLVFARSVCNINTPTVALVASAKTTDVVEDVLAWYGPEFLSLGWANDIAGVDTLRHVYTFMIGLAMWESSGKYCEGRCMSDQFSSANSAEAGIYQASWGAKRKSPVLMTELFDAYSKKSKACFIEAFSKDITCKAGNEKNWGTGTGMEWQKLTKECPAFATEYAAILMRVHAGNVGEFGPIKRKEVEIHLPCEQMLLAVQTLVQEDPTLCAKLK